MIRVSRLESKGRMAGCRSHGSVTMLEDGLLEVTSDAVLLLARVTCSAQCCVSGRIERPGGEAASVAMVSTPRAKHREDLLRNLEMFLPTISNAFSSRADQI